MEHILICLSSSPSNGGIIQAGAEMAQAFGADLLAVYVETPGNEELSQPKQTMLDNNRGLAVRAGARIETVFAADVLTGIVQFARLNGVTKIVMGQTASPHLHIGRKKDLAARLMEAVPEISVFIIPDKTGKSQYQLHPRKKHARVQIKDILITLAFLAGATLVGYGFQRAGYLESNIITLYILAVLLISVTTSGWLWGVVGSAAVVVIFNFLFIDPIFSFHAYDARYTVTFAVMLISAIVSGLLASRLKDYAEQYAIRAYRNKLLFDTNQILQQTTGERDILTAAAMQLSKLLSLPVILYYGGDNEELDGPYLVMPQSKEAVLSQNGMDIAEKPAAIWSAQNKKRCGKGTGTYPDCQHLYLAVRTAGSVYGVIGISGSGTEKDTPVYTTCLSIIGECALAAENDRNAREKEQARIEARNEQLRADLLRTISHDLRTPLTSISGNASTLMDSGDKLEAGTRKQIYTDIYDDSMWLITVVENLLSVTRLENGQMQMNVTDELVDDVIEEALRHVDRCASDHHIELEPCDSFCLARMDTRLISQVIINLVNNAIKYTQDGSTIRISRKMEGDMVRIDVADDGPGMPDEMKEHAFEMFYTGGNQVADGRRSLGLGLALCKSIVEAHGGEINVTDVVPKGARFSFTLPGREVIADE